MADLVVTAVARANAPAGEVDPAFWRGRRVMLTGHTGFKGAWLSLWLCAMGAQVVGVSVDVPTDPSLFELARVGGDLVDDVRLDIRDFPSLSRAVSDHRPEVIFHLAAQSLVHASFADPRQTYETNVMGTVNLLESVRLTEGVRVVINVTSDKCYENREWEWGYRETEPMGGLDPYSNSKGCSELLTSAFRRSFFSGSGTARLASARAGNVIGGGDWAADRLVPDMMRAALADVPVRVRHPGAVRPWQHVLNPLSGYLLLAQAVWASDAYADGWNFGPADDDARPVDWIVRHIAARWPQDLVADEDPGPHPHEAHYLKLDSSRAREQLGWRPRWNLAEGLDAVVSWYDAARRQVDMRDLSLAQIEAFTRT